MNPAAWQRLVAPLQGVAPLPRLVSGHVFRLPDPGECRGLPLVRPGVGPWRPAPVPSSSFLYVGEEGGFGARAPDHVHPEWITVGTGGGVKKGRMPGVWITTAQAASELGVSEGRVRQLLESGQLPGRRFGHAWAIGRADLERYRALP